MGKPLGTLGFIYPLHTFPKENIELWKKMSWEMERGPRSCPRSIFLLKPWAPWAGSMSARCFPPKWYFLFFVYHHLSAPIHDPMRHRWRSHRIVALLCGKNVNQSAICIFNAVGNYYPSQITHMLIHCYTFKICNSRVNQRQHQRQQQHKKKKLMNTLGEILVSSIRK